MKKEQVLIGLELPTAIVTAGHAQADEVTNKQSNKTTVQSIRDGSKFQNQM